jgi:hypothetical protein
MFDRTHNDVALKVAAIVDDALAELLLLEGVQSRDSAAELMACLAIARINDNEVRRAVERFAIDSVWDVDDTGGGPS